MQFRFLEKCSIILTLTTMSLACIAESPYGICAHLQRWEHSKADEEMKIIKAGGCDYIRTDIDWDQLETAPGKWNFTRWDTIANLAGKHGITMLPILGYDVKWARPSWQHLPEWLNYVKTVVGRYGAKTPYMEVWNEENLQGSWRDTPSGENYAKLLIPTYRAIKEQNPAIKVVYGGTSLIPMAYIEDSFKAGAAQAMDIMAIHPYRWKDIPETSLAKDVVELRRLMAKYGAGDKPIWFTEAGYNTAPGPVTIIIPQLLAALGMKPEQTTVYFFDDPEFRSLFEIPMRQLLTQVPHLNAIKGIRFNELATLPTDATTLLVLPETETFPADYCAALQNYVKRGGRILSPAGLPLYNESFLTPEGRLKNRQVNQKHMAGLHINWYTFWTKPETPKDIKKYEYAASYANLPLPPFIPSCRFFDEANLKPGDRFEPVLYGVNGKFRGVLAGVYHLDSDMKGKIAVCSMLGDGRVDPQTQAELLPRTMLIAFGAGVERIYWYSFRSTEWDYGAEAHFGIVNNNLTPKPAYAAYKTLTTMYPAGSTGLTVRSDVDLYTANWRKPNGESVVAVWTTEKNRQVTCTGTEIKAIDCLGKPLELKKGEANTASFTAGPGIVYLTGPVQIQLR